MENYHNGESNGKMENDMETRTIMGYIGVILWDNGKENGSYYIIMGYIWGL